MDKIFIKNLRVRAIIGVNPEERITPQDILINITIFTDVSRAAHLDDVSYTISYSHLARKAQDLAQKAERLTVEALAQDLAELCLKHKGVEKTIIRVEKPQAVESAESAGVEIERTAADL